MISDKESTCPDCGGALQYYDKVFRIVRSKWGHTERVTIRRLRCENCGHVHREIPELIFPHKHYEAEVITGVIEGLITPETLGFEDEPCEMTMRRWRARKLQRLL